MASSRIQKLKVASFTATIIVPMHKSIILFASKDISFWEKKFIEQRDNTLNAEEKKNYDRCRAILEWASICDASLCNVSSLREEVEFTFAFNKIKNVNDFIKNLDINVNINS